MTTAMIALLPKGEWGEAKDHDIGAEGLALNMGFRDQDPETGKLISRTPVSFHFTGITPVDTGRYADLDAEAVGRDRLASLFVKAASALFEDATPAVQKRMGALIQEANEAAKV
jgi:hypothetical protein